MSELVFRSYVKRTKGHYEVWKHGKQVAAGVGLNPQTTHPGFLYNNKMWKKKGIALQKGV